MTAPVVFQPAGEGREIAKLGVIRFAEVGAGVPGGRAWARVMLPGITTGPIPAGSLEQARQVVRDKLTDWLDATGLVAR
jgi:hypothetical protein